MGSRLDFRADCRWVGKNIGWDFTAVREAAKSSPYAPHGCPAADPRTLTKQRTAAVSTLPGSLRSSALVKPVQPPLPLRKLQELAPWPAA